MKLGIKSWNSSLKVVKKEKYVCVLNGCVECKREKKRKKDFGSINAERMISEEN
jgi:hypothetical protein